LDLEDMRRRTCCHHRTKKEFSGSLREAGSGWYHQRHTHHPEEPPPADVMEFIHEFDGNIKKSFKLSLYAKGLSICLRVWWFSRRRAMAMWRWSSFFIQFPTGIMHSTQCQVRHIIQQI
jgi:hypothetical protein